MQVAVGVRGGVPYRSYLMMAEDEAEAEAEDTYGNLDTGHSHFPDEGADVNSHDILMCNFEDENDGQEDLESRYEDEDVDTLVLSQEDQQVRAAISDSDFHQRLSANRTRSRMA